MTLIVAYTPFEDHEAMKLFPYAGNGPTHQYNWLAIW